MPIIVAFLVGSLLLDALVRPRASARAGLRSFSGIWLLWLLAALPFGVFLGVSGNPTASVIFSLLCVGLFTMVSNAKRTMLGEPLVFSDLALIGAVFRHPQFYLSALSRVQKGALLMAVPLLLGLLWVMFRVDPAMHLAGLGILATSLALIAATLRIPPWSGMATTTDHNADVERHGLLPTILIYWHQWCKSPDPAPPAPLALRPAPRELVVVIQCESFADPVALFDDPALELPALTAARAQAWQWGHLHVSGFGAYTMRTEYGVLFGRSEDELGFRRFDPFLTALREALFALPARLAAGGWHSLFVHPHDLRFYNRHEIMRAGGFAELVGPEHFSPPGPADGRYVSDAAIAAKIVDLAQAAPHPALIYAVTIENHGPWEVHDGCAGLVDGYMRLVRKGDAMLETLMADLARLQRAATLVFFGDHRPSIPGIVTPGEDRHTPYVILRLDENGNAVTGRRERTDLTPAELHHTLLGLLSTGPEGH